MATEVGQAQIKLSFDAKSLTNSMNSAEKNLTASGTNSGKSWANAWTIAAGNLIAKGIGKIINTITSNMDRAIKRVDTINNSSKVFTAMGYAVDDVSNSMGRLNEYLDGLPTSMTDAVQGVQSLSASFGGIQIGTDLFIAMNDAGLAFGATTDQVANAINQLGQLSLDGPLDAQTWNSLRNSGFGPVFAAMAKEAGITVGELKEQFGGRGTKTVGDFVNALVKMDKDGTKSMDSLANLARANTEGIGTAFENVQNRIAKAIEKIINHIGAERISGAINAISKGFTNVADVVINVIDFLVANKWILDVILAFFTGLLAMGIAAKVASFIQMIVSFASTNPILLAIGAVAAILVLVMTHLDEIKAWINENLPWLPPILEQIGAILGKIGEFIGWIFGELAKLWEFIEPVFKAIFELFKFLWDNIVYPIVQKIFEKIFSDMKILFDVFKGVFETVFTILKTFFDIASVIIGAVVVVFKGLWDAISAGVNWAVGVFKSVFEPIANWINDHVIQPIKGFFEGLWNGIKAGVQAVKDFIGNIFGTVGGIVKAPINGIISGVNSVLTKINSITIPDWVPFVGGAHTNFGMIPLLASGGVANGATQAIIGEAGREVVLPLERNTGNWSGLLAEALEKEMEEDGNLGSPQPAVINLYLDGQQVEQVILQDIRRAI